MKASAGYKDGGPSYDPQCRQCRLAECFNVIFCCVAAGAVVLFVIAALTDHTLLMFVAIVGIVAGLVGGVVAFCRENHSTHVAS